MNTDLINIVEGDIINFKGESRTIARFQDLAGGFGKFSVAVMLDDESTILFLQTCDTTLSEPATGTRPNVWVQTNDTAVVFSRPN